MEEKNMEMRHGAIYTCKTLRMLGYLKQKGFMPFVTEPDANNGRYLIIGTNSRFEDYGSDRTGCFWIGS